jgi:hypothetical protein
MNHSDIIHSLLSQQFVHGLNKFLEIDWRESNFQRIDHSIAKTDQKAASLSHALSKLT